MSTALQGIAVALFNKQKVGLDGFNNPIYEETKTIVENVLVSPLTQEEIIDTLNLTGRRAVYQLAIPKGDANDWEDKRVEFWGKSWKVIGIPIEGIEKLIPLKWNKKVKVERYA